MSNHLHSMYNNKGLRKNYLKWSLNSNRESEIIQTVNARNKNWQEFCRINLRRTSQWHKTISKVSFFVQCIKKQLITLQNFNIQPCFRQFLWFFSLKCWFKDQILPRIHLAQHDRVRTTNKKSHTQNSFKIHF